MKFIPVNSARKLQIDQPVFTLNDKDEYGFGKLVKEEKTAKGVERTFELATFIDNGTPPQLKATLVTNITHVAVP